MADNKNTPTPTPKPTPKSPTPEQANITENTPPANTNPQQANVTEQTPKDALTIDQPLKDLTIDQLNEKLKQNLSVDEFNNVQEEIKKRESEGNDDNDNKVINTDGDQDNSKEDEEKGPFQPGDIIEYMYKDWIIGGANWLWSKSAKHLEAGWFKGSRALKKSPSWLKGVKDSIAAEFNKGRDAARGGNGGSSGDEQNPPQPPQLNDGSANEAPAPQNTPNEEGPKDNTTKYFYVLDDHFLERTGQRTESLEKHNEKIQKDIKLMREGKLDESSFSKETKEFLHKKFDGKDNKERDSFCDYMSKSMKHLHDNLKNIEQSSAMLAKARMMDELSKNPHAFDNVNPMELFNAYQKQNKIMLMRRCDQMEAEGKNPIDFLNKTFDTAMKANERADENYNKGLYAENGKAPGENPYLDSLNKELDLAAQNKDNSKPMGIFESLNSNQDIAEAEQSRLNQISGKEKENEIRRSSNQERQQKLLATYEKLLAKDPNNAALKAKIAGYKALGVQSGVVDNDNKADKIIKTNENQSRRDQMKQSAMIKMLKDNHSK